jgi:hypothetical protein
VIALDNVGIVSNQRITITDLLYYGVLNPFMHRPWAPSWQSAHLLIPLFGRLQTTFMNGHIFIEVCLAPLLNLFTYWLPFFAACHKTVTLCSGPSYGGLMNLFVYWLGFMYRPIFMAACCALA